jgi:hypothetical protein
MKTLLALVVTAIAASSVLAQNPKDDPGGWTKAKWGMNALQITSEFSPRVVRRAGVPFRPRCRIATGEFLARHSSFGAD